MTVWVRQQLFFVERHRKLLTGISLLLLVVTLLSVFVSPAHAQSAASTQKTINFSARLKSADGKSVPDGLYNVSFKLYKGAEGGAP